jgi:hypothetical protein
MKITKIQLRQIVKEELNTILEGTDYLAIASAHLTKSRAAAEKEGHDPRRPDEVQDGVNALFAARRLQDAMEALIAHLKVTK